MATTTSAPSASACLAALLLVVLGELGDALRMINLDAPVMAFEGNTIKLSCFFALRGSSNSPTLLPAANRFAGEQPLEARQQSHQQQTPAQQKSKFSTQELGGTLLGLESNSSRQAANVDRQQRQPSEFQQGAQATTTTMKMLDKQREASGEPEVLYAIKWYKDEREFFRYLAQDRPHKQWLPTEGVLVDVSVCVCVCARACAAGGAD